MVGIHLRDLSNNDVVRLVGLANVVIGVDVSNEVLALRGAGDGRASGNIGGVPRLDSAFAIRILQRFREDQRIAASQDRIRRDIKLYFEATLALNSAAVEYSQGEAQCVFSFVCLPRQLGERPSKVHAARNIEDRNVDRVRAA